MRGADSTSQLFQAIRVFDAGFVVQEIPIELLEMERCMNELGRVLAHEVLMSYTIPRRCCAGSGWMRLVAMRLLYNTRGLVIVRPEALGGIWSLL